MTKKKSGKPSRKGSIKKSASEILPILRQIGQAFTLRIESAGLPANLSISLMQLYTYPECDEPASLAEVTCFPRQTMTAVLDMMEHRGLARRTPHPSDRRRKLIALTPKGRRTAASLIQNLHDFENEALAAMPRQDIDTFKRLIKCYADLLSQTNMVAQPQKPKDA